VELKPRERLFVICLFGRSIHVEMLLSTLEKEAKSYGSGIWLGWSK
jgi:hypothetical protein